MLIKYSIDKSSLSCETKCLREKELKVKYPTTFYPMIGSIGCQQCEYFASVDKENKIVNCLFKKEK